MFGKQLFVLLGVVLFGIGCNNASDEQTQTKTQVPVDVESAFFSSTAVQPCTDMKQSLLRTVNDVTMRIAAKEGKDSALVYDIRDSSGKFHAPTTTRDVQVFPVVSEAALVAGFMGVGSYDLRKDTMRIHQINFDNQFVLMVCHPPVFSDQMYRDMVTINDSTQSTLWIDYNFGVLQDNNAGVLSGRWQNSVYALPRKTYDRLGVVFRGDTTYYDLKEKK